MSNVGRDDEEQEETAQRKAELRAKKMEEERREKYEKLNAWKVCILNRGFTVVQEN